MPSGRECIANGRFSAPFEMTAEGGKLKGRRVWRSKCQMMGCRYKQNKRQCLGYIEVDANTKDANKTLMKYIKDHVAGHEEQVRKDAAGATTPPLSVAVAVGVPIKEAPPPPLHVEGHETQVRKDAVSSVAMPVDVPIEEAPPSAASADAEIHEKEKTPEEIEEDWKISRDRYTSTRTFLDDPWDTLDDDKLKNYILHESYQVHGPRLFPKMDLIGPINKRLHCSVYYCVLSNNCGDCYGIWLSTTVLYAVPEYLQCMQQFHREGKKFIEFRDRSSVEEVNEEAAGPTDEKTMKFMRALSRFRGVMLPLWDNEGERWGR